MRFPWSKPEKRKPVGDLKAAQTQIDGIKIAQMQRSFREEFSHVYGDDWMELNGSMIYAVGPMHTFIGWAITNGYIKDGDSE